MWPPAGIRKGRPCRYEPDRVRSRLPAGDHSALTACRQARNRPCRHEPDRVQGRRLAGGDGSALRRETPLTPLLWQQVNRLSLHNPGRRRPSWLLGGAVLLLVEEQSRNVDDRADSQPR